MITPAPKALSKDSFWTQGSDPTQWGSLLNNTQRSSLMNFHPPAHLNAAYGLHGFPSFPSLKSMGSYETYFSSPPRSKARFTIWPLEHSSPAKPDSLIELSLRALCLACTNHSTEHGAMWLMGNDKRWISRGKIMGFNHVKVPQAQSSLAASCPAQVTAGFEKANHLQTLMELF